MTRAFQELYGVRDAFNGIPFNGRTDAWILSRAAAAHGVGADDLSRFKPRYLDYLAVELQQPGPRKGVMPGVRPLLDALSSREDVFLALLTGNFAEGARLKLEHFDLWRYFTCGAFGDVVHERNHLLADALSQVAARSGLAADPSHAVSQLPSESTSTVSSAPANAATSSAPHSTVRHDDGRRARKWAPAVVLRAGAIRASTSRPA